MAEIFRVSGAEALLTKKAHDLLVAMNPGWKGLVPKQGQETRTLSGCQVADNGDQATTDTIGPS
jgi:hypothetical protein